MDYRQLKLKDVLPMMNRHELCAACTAGEFDDTIAIWAAGNFHEDTSMFKDVDEICGYVYYVVGAFRDGIIDEEVYLRAMNNIDGLLRNNKTSLERELLYY